MPTYSGEPQRFWKYAAEVRDCAYGFTRELRSGVTLTGTPTVTTSAGPTISNQALNATAITIQGQSHAVNMAVLFRVSGGTAANSYDITISVATTGGETIIEKIAMDVK